MGNVENDPLCTRLNKNVITKGKTFGIPNHNIVEAIFFVFLTVLIILAINFTKLVTNICLIILVPIVLIFFLRGLKSRSVLQLLVSEIKFRINRKILHLRSPEYVRKENRYANEESADESVVEAIGRIAKEKYREFIEKNSDI